MSILTQCKKASIYSLEHEYICDVKVQRLDAEEDTAILVFPDDFIDSLWMNVYVTFYDNYRGLVTYHCSLTDYKKELVSPSVEKHTALCHMEDLDVVLDRRNDIKIYRDIPITLTGTDLENESEFETNAMIRNISAGGIFFISRRPFLVGQRAFSFFERGNPPLLLEIEVLRTQDVDTDTLRNYYVPEGQPVMGYGCRFINLSRWQESVIRSYVFQQDINERKKE